MNIIPLPYLPIFEFHLENENIINQSFNELISKDIEWIISDDRDPNSVKIGYIDNKKRIPVYSETLWPWLQECIDKVGMEVFKRDVKFKICDNWLVRSTYLNRSQIHAHSSSTFSGIFYFTDNESAKTVFHFNNTYIENESPKLPYNKYINEFSVTSKRGKLIIFPSGLHHSITANKVKSPERYTLAFNVYATGVIGPVETGFLNIYVKDSESRHREYFNN